MKTTKKKKAKVVKVASRRAVLWECPDCLTDNLHPTDAWDFVCINCGMVLITEGPKSANCP
jgi:predicted RNA-binding Zn-ribbon protein involved in translation (DUF1610 family)